MGRRRRTNCWLGRLSRYRSPCHLPSGVECRTTRLGGRLMKTDVLRACEARSEVLLREIIARSPKWARQLILSGYRGSHAHGTCIPPNDPHGTDDIDVFGVFGREDQYYHGVSGYL